MLLKNQQTESFSIHTFIYLYISKTTTGKKSLRSSFISFKCCTPLLIMDAYLSIHMFTTGPDPSHNCFCQEKWFFLPLNCVFYVQDNSVHTF